MRYDWRDDILPDEGTREYFEQIDRRYRITNREQLTRRAR
jgi:hypothetical protein